MKFFSKLINFIFGYFDPTNIFFEIKINNFWGDLGGISAKTATLIATSDFAIANMRYMSRGNVCTVVNNSNNSMYRVSTGMP